jgi:hypothetical protein
VPLAKWLRSKRVGSRGTERSEHAFTLLGMSVQARLMIAALAALLAWAGALWALS